MSDQQRTYASEPAISRGRRYAQPDAPTRNAFQRDRDRIVHSTAFRRLVYKTQVFINHEGDLFRTRLTHSLEVAQLGRSVARTLGLNEDLVETIALAHDLGHTPFGHAGQDALNECMKPFGGFEHNLQSLRVVDWLEERYPQFDGLNLSFEAREGILKHCSRHNAEAIEAMEPIYADGGAGVGYRFLVGGQPSLEAQLCNLADEIAYNAHDIDDGVRSGLLTMEQLQDAPLFAQFSQAALAQHPELSQATFGRRWLYESIRLMLSAQVYDLIAATQSALKAAQPPSVAAVRQYPHAIVCFTSEMREKSRAMKAFLFKHLYRHPQVTENMGRAKQVIADLFAEYCNTPTLSHNGTEAPVSGLAPKSHLNDTCVERRVADYIAGMTDRFALREHERLTGQRLFPN
jgi:dGTPase